MSKVRYSHTKQRRKKIATRPVVAHMPYGVLPCDLWLKGKLIGEYPPDSQTVFFKAFYFRKQVYFQIHSDRVPHLNERPWMTKKEFVEMVDPVKITVPKSVDKRGWMFDTANNQDYLNAVIRLGQPA